MSRKPRQKPLEPADKSPLGWARWWFAMGCGPQGTARQVEVECGLDAAQAESVYKAMREELRADIERLRANIEDQAACLFRSIKGDPAADWGSRQRAQFELEKLLDLVAWAQTPEGMNDDEVLEAIAFHEQLIAAREPSAGQKLRSQRRLMQLFGYRHDSGRRQPGGDRPRTAAFPAERAPAFRSTHSLGESRTDFRRPSEEVPDELAQIERPVVPAEAKFDAAARQQLMAALDLEAEQLEAEFDRQLAAGDSADELLDKFEPRMHENALRRIALRQIERESSVLTEACDPRATGPPH